MKGEILLYFFPLLKSYSSEAILKYIVHVLHSIWIVKSSKNLNITFNKVDVPVMNTFKEFC